MTKVLVVLILFGLIDSAYGIDQASQTATEQTQALLRNKSKRKEAVKTGDAKKMDDYINELAHGDPKIVQKIYELAADILPDTVKDADGDPKKMKTKMGEYKDNPEDFINNMTPEQRKKLEELSRLLTPGIKPD